jgi:hypothetical protein
MNFTETVPPCLFSETSDFERLPEPRRYWPVVLECTEHRITWVEADTHQKAVDHAKEYSDGDDWENGERVDLYAGPTVTDGWIARGAVEDYYRDQDWGPFEACPECGAVATSNDSQALTWASHTGGCSRHIHHVDLVAAWPPVDVPQRDLFPVGWWPVCSCAVPGWDRARLWKAAADAPGVPPHLDKGRAIAALHDHIVGRPHSKYIPYGITDRVDHPNPRGTQEGTE